MTERFPAAAVELDAEGFAPSFSPSQIDALKAFFEEFGFVVVRDLLCREEVAEATADVFRAAGFAGGVPPIGTAALDAVDWSLVYGSSYNRSKGFLGSEPPDTPRAWKSRLAPQLHAVFAALFGREDLLVKLDRYGLMRPTLLREGAAPEATPMLRKQWQTTGEWIHWDQNPWEEPEFARIQGVLALSEHTQSSGGFHCVPGFCRHWKQWAAHNEEYRMGSGLVAVPTGDPMRAHIQRILMRAGSIVLWDARTPHGNYVSTLGLDVRLPCLPSLQCFSTALPFYFCYCH